MADTFLDYAARVGALIKGLDTRIDATKLANSSVGTGAPAGTAPLGWHHTDVATDNVYRMEAEGWTRIYRSSVPSIEIQSLAPDITSGQIKFEAWKGVAYLTFVNVQATGIVDVFPSRGILAAVCPVSGTEATAVLSGASRCTIFDTGRLAIYGTWTNVNGTLTWPMRRPIPSGIGGIMF